jgi:acyl-CoA thioesterase-1
MGGHQKAARHRAFPILLFAGLSVLPACSSTSETMEGPPIPGDLQRPAATSPTSASDLPVILAFGDSLTAGHDVDRDMAYPSQLQRRLDEEGYAYRVVNQGVGGDTTSGGRARLARALELEPEVVILELGANDGLLGVPIPTARENLAAMIEAFQSVETHVVLAGLTLPRNYGPDRIREFEDMFTGLADEYDTALIPFFLEGLVDLEALDSGQADPRDFARTMQSDGTHPTAAGYTIVSETVFDAIEPYLARAEGTAND